MPNGVLRNKLGITDHQLLNAAEADITRARLVMLTERPQRNEDASVKGFLGQQPVGAGTRRAHHHPGVTPLSPDRQVGRLLSAARLRFRPPSHTAANSTVAT
jgi:hypothetical protein